MRKDSFRCLMCYLFLLVCLTLSGCDRGVSGQWEGQMSYAGAAMDYRSGRQEELSDSFDIEMSLHEDGDSVSGTIHFHVAPYTITEGSVSGDTVKLMVVPEVSGYRLPHTLTGTLEGDTIEGEVECYMSQYDRLIYTLGSFRVTRQ